MAAEVELERMMVRLMGDGSHYQRMLSQAQAQTATFGQQMGDVSAKLSGATNMLRGFGSQVVNTASSLVGLSSIFGMAYKAVSSAAAFEEQEVAFGTMLRNMEHGKVLMQELKDLGAQTPLNLPDLQSGARTLLQFGVAGGDVTRTLRMLGDAAGGNAQRLQSMALAYGQARAAGRLMGNDVFQMINAGFNPLQETAEHMAKTMGGVASQHMITLKKRMEAGQFTLQMMEDSFKRATSAGGRFFNGMENASKTLSGLFSTMQDDIGGFFRELGFFLVEGLRLKEVVAGVSAGAQMLTAWFTSLSTETKTTILIVGGLAASLGTLLALWPVIMAVAGPVLAAVGGALSALLGPVGLVAAGVVGLGAIFVNQMGGWAKTWEALQKAAVTAWNYVRQKTTEFVTWVKPITDAIGSFFVTAWKKTQQVAVWLWGQLVAGFDRLAKAATWAWEKVGGNTIDWNAVRTAVQDAIIFAEFTLENLGQVAEVVWAGMLYHAVRFGNEVVWVFTDLIPAGLQFFTKNFATIFSQVMVFAEKMWTGFRTSAVDSFTSVITLFADWPRILSGEITPVEVIARAMAGAFKSGFDPVGVGKDFVDGIGKTLSTFEVPKREIGEIERKLRDEYARLGATLGEDFGKFRQKKLDEWAAAGVITPQQKSAMEKVALETGVTTAQNMMKGFQSQKFDVALMGSAEAIARIAEYSERLKPIFNPMGGAAAPGGGAGGGAGVGPAGPLPPLAGAVGRIDVMPAGGAAAKQKQEEQVDILKQIRDGIKAMTGNPGIQVEGAGLT